MLGHHPTRQKRKKKNAVISFEKVVQANIDSFTLMCRPVWRHVALGDIHSAHNHNGTIIETLNNV